MLGMKNHFNISGSTEIHEVDIVGVVCISVKQFLPILNAEDSNTAKYKYFSNTENAHCIVTE